MKKQNICITLQMNPKCYQYIMKYMLTRLKTLKVEMGIMFGNLKIPYMG